MKPGVSAGTDGGGLWKRQGTLLAHGLSSLPHQPGLCFWQISLSLSLFLLELHMRPMEAPRLGVELKLQLPAYTTATAMRDLSHICDLHHSSQQRQILNPLSEAGDRTRILMDPSQTCFCWATTEAPSGRSPISTCSTSMPWRQGWQGWPQEQCSGPFLTLPFVLRVSVTGPKTAAGVHTELSLRRLSAQREPDRLWPG